MERQIKRIQAKLRQDYIYNVDAFTFTEDIKRNCNIAKSQSRLLGIAIRETFPLAERVQRSKKWGFQNLGHIIRAPSTTPVLSTLPATNNFSEIVDQLIGAKSPAACLSTLQDFHVSILLKYGQILDSLSPATQLTVFGDGASHMANLQSHTNIEVNMTDNCKLFSMRRYTVKSSDI